MGTGVAPTSVARLIDHSGGPPFRIECIDGVVHRRDEHHVVRAWPGIARSVRTALRVDLIVDGKREQEPEGPGTHVGRGERGFAQVRTGYVGIVSRCRTDGCEYALTAAIAAAKLDAQSKINRRKALLS